MIVPLGVKNMQEKSDFFAHWRVLLRGICLPFELVVDDSADEGVELVVALEFACFGVSGSLGIGVVASDAGNLGLKAGLPELERVELLLGGVVFGSEGCEDLARPVDGVLEESAISEFVAGLWARFEVAGVVDFVEFVLAFFDYAPAGVAERFASMNGSVFDHGAVNSSENRIKICCHSRKGCLLYVVYTFVICLWLFIVWCLLANHVGKTWGERGNDVRMTYESPTYHLGITYESPRVDVSECGCKGSENK